MAQHRNLPDAELHEPKGVVSAPASTVYVSTGTGSGVWKRPGVNEIDRTNLRGLNQFTLGVYHPDINKTKSAYTHTPFPGVLTSLSAIIDAPVTVDTTISLFKNGVTSLGSVVVAAGSVEGGRFTFNLPTLSIFAAGDFIKITSTGGGTGTTSLNIVLVFNHTFT